uniref:Retrotransposon protein, putative, Ty3-gypsy subclass n=1 Tax=Oryza sativa subsp. japonica TaxID=39947 RepID=Q2QNP8_ORYSJ|nr:retrotransposon protein, putative, Ty3-gypsy subclass [Oryza sativa Japonica Group]
MQKQYRTKIKKTSAIYITASRGMKTWRNSQGTGLTGPWLGLTGGQWCGQTGHRRSDLAKIGHGLTGYGRHAKDGLGESKVKKVKKVWVRKEAKAPEVVTIKEKSQDVQVPTGDAAKIIQVEKTEAGTVTVNIGGLTETAGRSNRQSTAGLTDPPGRYDRRLAAGLTGPRGRSDRGALKLAPTAVLNPIIKLWPFRGWALDFIGQIYSSSSKGYWFVLVVMDYFTKWAEAVPLENITCTEEQDDLSVENYKTLMGSNFEDVIDKRLKTLKEMKTLQDDWEMESRRFIANQTQNSRLHRANSGTAVETYTKLLAVIQLRTKSLGAGIFLAKVL